MASRDRTREDKVGDLKWAFDMLRMELTPQTMRDFITKLSTTPAPEPITGSEDPAIIMANSKALEAYAALVQSGMAVGRMVTANDRTAMIAAAMMMQSGVSRPVIDADGEV